MSNLFSNLVSRKNTKPEEKPVSVSEKEEKTETQQKKEQDAEKDFIFVSLNFARFTSVFAKATLYLAIASSYVIKSPSFSNPLKLGEIFSRIR